MIILPNSRTYSANQISPELKWGQSRNSKMDFDREYSEPSSIKKHGLLPLTNGKKPLDEKSEGSRSLKKQWAIEQITSLVPNKPNGERPLNNLNLRPKKRMKQFQWRLMQDRLKI
jgi:hypothetical protein